MAEAKKTTNTNKRRRKTSSSTGKINVKKMFQDVKKPALIVLGFWAGKQVSALIDKNTGTISGFLGVDGKKILKPGIQILVGLGASQLIKNENFKFIGYGVAAHGAYELVKDGFGKDLLKGVNGLGNPNDAIQPAPDLMLPQLKTKLDELEREELDELEREELEGVEGEESIEELEQELKDKLSEEELEGIDDEELDEDDDMDYIEVE